MPSRVHEAVVELFRNEPGVAVRLLNTRGVRVSGTLEVADTNLSELAPTEYLADLVLKGDNVYVIIEAQRTADARKRRSWLGYVASLSARHGCDVVLLVVVLDEAVAAWAREPIRSGHPGFNLIPLVIGPTQLPKRLDPSLANACPELAVLCTLVHGGGRHGLALGRAGLAAVRSLDEERSRLYADLIIMSLNAAAKAVLEKEMLQNYEYQSEFARKFIQVGREEGREEQAAQAILDVLAARGLVINEVQHAQIVGCRDLAVLRRWLARAVVVAATADTFVA